MEIVKPWKIVLVQNSIVFHINAIVIANKEHSSFCTRQTLAASSIGGGGRMSTRATVLEDIRGGL